MEPDDLTPEGRPEWDEQVEYKGSAEGKPAQAG